MTVLEQIFTVAVVMSAILLTRFLPFLLFRTEKNISRFVIYLGKVLPAAVFGLLVVYCFKNVSFFSGNYALPEFISVAAVAGLHLWKRQTLLSIAGGTAVYMFLTKLVF